MTHETEKQKVEELCEEIWALSEIGGNEWRRVIEGSKIREAADVLDRMVESELVHLEGDRVGLSGEGRRIARSIVRRHRLAEMLFTQVLSLTEELSETTACEMEHILSTPVADSVCTFLGHPPLCPHGKPIPRGRCCELVTRDVKPLVSRLLDLSVGDRAKVVLIHSESHVRLNRIGALGLFPGSVVRLIQKRPAVVIAIGETTLALDREIAEEVWLRRIEPDGAL